MPTTVNRNARTMRLASGGPSHRQRLGCAPRGGKGSSESTTNGGVHMSKRFLMRLGKTPFEVFDGFDTLDRNTIGRNNGNLIFGMAAHKLFSTADTVVDANRYKINGAMAAKVNDEYDGFILPLANAFRPGFEAELARTTDFIEKLTIPFLMLSGGAQLPLDGDPAALKKIEPTVRRFAKAVLEKSSALTVRGELTAEYLRSLGFKDVIVVGCPSLTMNGRGHRVDKPDELPSGAAIAYNLQTNNPFGTDLIHDAESNYDATYMPQDLATLEFMLWGTGPYQGHDRSLPLDRSHPQFMEKKAQFQLDAPEWMRRMGEQRFSFGPRIHGNVAGILAGTPGIVLAHDGRTLELSRYHGVPAIDLTAEEAPETVAELYERADFSEFNRGHAERFDRLADFIHDNGFSHIYEPGQEKALADYNRRLDAVEFPEPQTSLWQDTPPEFVRMASVLQQRYLALKKTQKALKTGTGSGGAAELEKRIRNLEKRLSTTEASLKRSQASAAEVRATANRTDRRLNKLLGLPLGVKRMLGRRRSR